MNYTLTTSKTPGSLAHATQPYLGASFTWPVYPFVVIQESSQTVPAICSAA